ncbi:hypothetical protein P344_06925 [Spiroplasma mirum ATCC 29335]|uniref:Uncharacterized protein n=1 Tax=Spiroplasma mirum ATCC 29335 TaxID=838561 RepID=W0GSH2_9MOLU|nr:MULTISPECIES: hypothetical protein [Spiroplasma]AHF61531.1 hypothetical protein SMM_1164 [Spiroplasma mirum ATCC 29335]AHI58683.1 hypothetical protein P344_06925 [Spiroplasma mirum ATCC 29335]AKM53570.1 hypothetical protein SATRI_v1c12350 [Spiroplasma atrichopogonis]
MQRFINILFLLAENNSNNNASNNLDHHTQMVIWGWVIGVSFVIAVILILLHFFWWKNRIRFQRDQTMKIAREWEILDEIKGNIFLILASLFAIAFVVGIVTIIKLAT